MIELILNSIDEPTLFIWLFMPLYFIGFLILHKLIGEKKGVDMASSGSSSSYCVHCFLWTELH